MPIFRALGLSTLQSLVMNKRQQLVLFYQACLPLSQHIRNKPEIHGFEKE
jgi:hypothetical protein